MLDPLETSRRIDEAFLGYLRSTFGPRRPDLRHDYHRSLSEGSDLSRGPIVQATAPFKPGRSIRELVTAGVLSKGFEQFADSFPLARALHLHQDQAIVRSVQHERNLVVSTGTGSGKTKAFYLPAFAKLATLVDGKAWTKLVAVYPRTELLKDQLQKSLAELRNLYRRTGVRLTLGASFGAQSYSLRWTRYGKGVGKGVWGLRAVAEASTGDLPFYLRPYVSLRGVLAMRYAGERAASVETEYRWPLGERWDVLAFGGLGTAVSDRRGAKGTKTVSAGGLGVRFKARKYFGLTFGVDLAQGPDGLVGYVQIGNAWGR